MTRHTMAKLVSTFVVAAGCIAAPFLSGTALAQQQSNSTGTGIKISPVRTELTVEPGTSKSVDVTVQNMSSSTTDFNVVINDFVGGREELGQPSLLLDEKSYAPSHSLKRYIADVPRVSIEGGQSKTIKITINIPKDAPGGGYYGAVRFAPADKASGKNVTLSASVASLLLVKVPGDIKENVNIESFDVRRGKNATAPGSLFATTKDIYATVRFKNSGNIHEQPFGKVTLKKGSTVVQTVEINNTEPRGNVLPDTIRRFDLKLDKLTSWGKYSVEGNFGYGTNGQLLSANASFVVVPLLPLAALLALVLLGLGWWAVRRRRLAARRASARRR